MARLTNWAGNVTFSTPHLERPRSIDELAALVASTSRVRALGTGHSFSRIADTDGTLVTVADLVGEIEIDEAARTVCVPAGMRFGELGTGLQARGWALANLGSLPHISVAGACATGTHGSGDANTCIAATATAVEFIDGTGQLISMSERDPGFGGAVLALGAIGIVTRVTLRIEPTYYIRQDVWLDLPWASLVEHVEAILGAGHSVSVFAGFERAGVADKVWIKSRADAVDASRWGATRATAAQHPVTGHDPAAATEQLGVPGPWHDRLPHFRLAYTPSTGHEQQSEYLIGRRHASAALDVLGALGPSLRPALMVCEIRSVAADDLWLSPCRERDTLAVHVTWIDDDRLVVPAVARLEHALAPFDPRPHWGKVFGLDPAAVRAHYPRLADFRALRDRHDPERRFTNPFLDTYL